MKILGKNILTLLLTFCCIATIGSQSIRAATKLNDISELQYANSDIKLNINFGEFKQAGIPDDQWILEGTSTLTLDKESYVGLKYILANSKSDFTKWARTTVTIYRGDVAVKSFETKTLDKEDTYDSTLLTPGVYTVKVVVSGNYWNSYLANGELNLKIGYIPVNDVISVKQSYKNKECTVSVDTAISNCVRVLRYRKGSVPAKYKDSINYWCDPFHTTFTNKCNDEKCVDITTSSIIKVSKTGSYTINVVDKNGTTVSKVFKLPGTDKIKPVIKGVENNKTYKKAVTVKFSDKDSGIKSAKLNGKSIKSGYKVKKKGSYKLIVTDYAGNKITLKFKVKK